jgi:hypothetical protein
MPSLRSKREMRERREMQAVGQILTLSRLTSFPACLAAGPACVLMRPRLGVALRSRLPGVALSPGNRGVCVGKFMGFFSCW